MVRFPGHFRLAIFRVSDIRRYSTAAERYFGETQGRQWVEQLRGMFTHMARIEIQPHWVGILDFETRFPSAIAAAM
jgi:hypothetical protein